MCSKTLWGRNLWAIFHIISFEYEIKDIIDSYLLKDFFDDVGENIPCPICKQHYLNKKEDFLKNETFESNEKLIEALIELHNQVNKDLGKYSKSFNEYYEYWQDYSSRKTLFYHLYQIDNCHEIDYEFKRQIYRIGKMIKKKSK